MKVRFLLLVFGVALVSSEGVVSKSDGCFLRCVAQCVAFVAKGEHIHTNQSFESCQPPCRIFKDEKICSDDACWSTCNGHLESEKTLPAPSNLTILGVRGFSWNPVPGAVMYYVGYKTAGSSKYTSGDYTITGNHSINLSYLSNLDPCSDLEVVVAAFSEDGIGNESSSFKITSPKPTANPKLELLGMQYLNTSLISDFYRANATVHVEFRYLADPWFLGKEDLDVQPLFHLISCVDPDLSQGIPVPDFVMHVQNSTISTSIGSDMMDRKCRYVYYLQTIKSKKCQTMTEMPSPPSSALQTVQVECDIVKGAPCFKIPSFPHPQCGQVENIDITVLSNDRDKLNDPTANVTVNVTFKPVTRMNDLPTVYYIGIYGDATEYHTKEEEAFLGVNITKVLGKESSCQTFDEDGMCLIENSNRSIIIPGLHPKNLYGLTICAVKDIRNLTLPDLSATSKSVKPKAVKLMLYENRYKFYSLVPYQLLIQSVESPFVNDPLTDLLLHENDTHLESGHFMNISSSVSTPCTDTNETNALKDDGYNNKTSPKKLDNIYNTTLVATENTSGEYLEKPHNFSASIETTIMQTRPSNSAGWIAGIIVGITAILLLSLLGCCCYYRKDRKRQLKKYKLEIAHIGKHNNNRYTDFPIASKNDIWEIERRNLIIHNDKKLGSGAFGAVYLGKLIGKLLAHKDANSPLGINLMRTENCQVAVKMLPEYADEMSKHEFLREIALMKTLGYHERLVNMLACVTDSEPLCLVVEYCDSGDLLQFLRERCKYMMKLDDLSISYHEPPVNDNYDASMIITMKQLLQFSVQISYGLEYLSQKGFVHRDVAARNILVHEGSTCKIGDFGLCRYIYADQSQYKSKGGKLPLKWMSPEAIRHYEFSIKSDVWSFGVLLFEIITLGGSPYPGMPPEDMLPFLENNGRIEKPDNCPENFYEVMKHCWCSDPEERIEFSDLRMRLATQLEDIADDYNYLKLDAAKDYYNVQYGNEKKDPGVMIDPEDIKQSTDALETV